ncbi:hypothetical protein FRC09_010894, partial [Ceratobasidium sp. 395]
MFAALAANPATLTQFSQFLATQQNAQPPPPTAPSASTDNAREPDHRSRSPTIGRSSDPVGTTEEQERGRSTQRSGPTASGSAKGPALPPSTPPRTSSANPQPLPPRPSSTSPRRPSPSPPRSQSPAPRAPGRPRHGKSPAKKPKATPESIAYYTCPTSYEKRQGKRGSRVHHTVDGKRQVRYTDLERLGTRKAKYEYVKKNGHLFGRMHGMYFNPYSARPSKIQNYKRVKRPPGFTTGRGEFQIFEAIGLRGDYEYYKDILFCVRKAVVKYQPQNIELEEGTSYKWKHYGSGARQAIQKHVRERFPFFNHHRDETGDDSWAISLLAIQYLESAHSYTTYRGKKKTQRYLRRHTSNKKDDEDEDEDEEEEEEEEEGEGAGEGKSGGRINLGDYKDDYDDNAAPHQSKGAGPSRSKVALPRAQQPTASTSRAPAPDLPPQSTNRDNRRADKLVAREEARARAQPPVKSVAASTSTIASKGKCKKHPPRKQVLPASTEDNGLDDSESDNEAARQVTKVVTCRDPPSRLTTFALRTFFLVSSSSAKRAFLLCL